MLIPKLFNFYDFKMVKQFKFIHWALS